MLFLDSKIQQTEIISHSIISLCISSMCPFDYKAEDKSERWKKNAEMPEKRLFLRTKRRFSLADCSSRDGEYLGENALKTAPQKRSLRSARDSSSARDVKTINLDYLKVASPPRKRDRKSRSTVFSTVITRSANSLSYGSCLLQHSAISAVERPVTAHVDKMTVVAKNGGEHATQPRIRIYAIGTFRL